MPKLTELYKCLSAMEEEIEDAVAWVEHCSDNVKLSVDVTSTAEARIFNLPYWMERRLEEKFRKTLLENIRTIIEEKVQEKTDIEVQFIQEVSRDKIKEDEVSPLTRVDAAIQRGG